MSTVRRALVLAGCGMLSVGLAACESTEQESAKIGHESEVAAHTATKRAAPAHGATAVHRHSHAPVRAAGAPRSKGSSSR